MFHTLTNLVMALVVTASASANYVEEREQKTAEYVAQIRLALHHTLKISNLELDVQLILGKYGIAIASTIK